MLKAQSACHLEFFIIIIFMSTIKYFKAYWRKRAENLVMSGKFSRSICTETIIWNYFFGIYFSIHMMTEAMRAENMTLTEYVRMTSLLLQRCGSKDYRTFTVQSFVLHETLWLPFLFAILLWVYVNKRGRKQNSRHPKLSILCFMINCICTVYLEYFYKAKKLNKCIKNWTIWYQFI